MTADRKIATHLRAVHGADCRGQLMPAIVAGAVDLSGAVTGQLLLVEDERLSAVTSSDSREPIVLEPGLLEALLSISAFTIMGDRAEPFGELARLLTGPQGGAIIVPLRCELELFAVLLLEFDDRTQTPKTDDPELIFFAEQASLALRRLKYVESLRREVEGLSAFITIDEALARTPNFEMALGQIIDRVKELVDAEAGGLMLYDPETDQLSLQKPALGYSDDVIRSYHVPAGGGENSATALVFSTGKPHLSNALDRDPVIHPGFAKAPGARNMMSVPLDVDNRRIGVFHVVNKRGGDFAEKDLRLLSLLASHLGILIHNARLLEQERLAVAKLQDANEVIDRQRKGLQRTLTIHDDLTRMVLDGEGPAAIVATLSKLVDNPVSLEDRFGNEISYHPFGDLRGDQSEAAQRSSRTRAIREDAASRGILPKLGQERRPVRMAVLPRVGADNPVVVAPVVVGGETMGYVYVEETNRALDDVDLMAVERAALAIALRMMKEKAAAESRYKLRGDFVIELLEGSYGPDEMLLSRATYLGIDLSLSRNVLVIDVDDFTAAARKRGTEEMILALKQRLLDIVQRASYKAAPESVVSAKSDEIIILANAATARASARRIGLQKFGDHLRAEIRRSLPEISVSIGIGGSCERLADYARSYQQARRALDAIKAARQSDRTLACDDLGIYGVIFDPHNKDKLASLVDDALGPLLQYDRQHASQLTETLDQYLLNDCHLERTASALGIHLSTLRYRLLRIEQIAGADLHSVETKFNLQLALKVWRTSSGGEAFSYVSI